MKEGNPASFSATTNVLFLAAIVGGRAPATWKFRWILGGPPICSTAAPAIGDVILNEVSTFQCLINQAGVSIFEATMDSFTISPNPLDTTNPPASAIITGQGFSAQYGMPRVQYFDMYGNLVAEATATIVAADGTWMQVAVPDVSSLASGTYVGLVSNANAGGGWDALGSVALAVFTLEPPPPPPSDPCSPDPCIIQ